MKSNYEFKVGLPGTRTVIESFKFNSYYIFKMTTYFILLSLVGLIAIASIRNLNFTGAKFKVGLLVEFGANLLIFCFLLPIYLRKIRKYSNFWFRLNDGKIQEFADPEFRHLSFELPYERVVSFHYVNFYFWDARIFGGSPIYKFCFIRFRSARHPNLEWGLDLGPKNPDDLERLKQAIQQKCPQIEIFDTVNSLRGIIATR